VHFGLPARNRSSLRKRHRCLEVIPPERRFLLYYRDAQLDRDLERYRLYTRACAFEQLPD